MSFENPLSENILSAQAGGVPSVLGGPSTEGTVGCTKAVVLYARASKKKQLNSVEDQLKVLREFCRQKGYVIKGEYRDIASGKYIKNRPGFAQMRRAIRRKECQAVLVHDFSRLGRKVSNLLKLSELGEQNGVQLESVTNGILTNMHVMALGMVAQIQLDVASDQIKRAHQSNILDGLRAGARIYGYRSVEVDGKRGHLEIVPHEAAIVREIFQMADDGMKPYAICRSLNLRDTPVPAPMGGKWRVSTLTSPRSGTGFLHNQTYKGFVVYNRVQTLHDAETEKSKQRVRERDQWWINKGQHEPIITVEQFDRVQEKLAQKSRGKPIPGPRALFAGLIKCPYCSRLGKDGSPIYRTMGPSGSPPGLRCYNVLEGICRHNRCYPRDQVYREVLRGLLGVLRDPSTVQKYLDEHAREANAAMKDVAAKFEAIGRQIGRIEKEVKQLYSAIAKGGDAWRLNEEIKNRVTAKHEAEATLEVLASKVTEFQLKPTSVEKYLGLVETIHEKLDKSESIGGELIEIMNSLVDRIFIRPLEGRRGFEVEVFGKLASIVSATESFRSVFDKGSKIKQMLDVRSLGSAAEHLRISLFKRQFTRITVDEAVLQVLADEMEPVVIGKIVQKLADIGLVRERMAVVRACKRAQDRGDILLVRQSGMILRRNFERLKLKFFLSSREILDVCEEILTLIGPLTVRELLDQIAKRGKTLANRDPATSLPWTLRLRPDLFKCDRQQRWLALRTPPKALVA